MIFTTPEEIAKALDLELPNAELLIEELDEAGYLIIRKSEIVIGLGDVLHK